VVVAALKANAMPIGTDALSKQKLQQLIQRNEPQKLPRGSGKTLLERLNGGDS